MGKNKGNRNVLKRADKKEGCGERMKLKKTAQGGVIDRIEKG